MSIPYEKKGANHKRSRNLKILTFLVLMVALAVNVAPILAGPQPVEVQVQPTETSVEDESSLVFKAEADARVEQANPTANTGTSDDLESVRANNGSVESYIRFQVSGVSGEIQSARLRVYSTTDSSENGPAVYAVNNDWTEADITWSNRPRQLSKASDNKDVTRRYTWVEYDVTSLVTGDGAYSFVLIADSEDGVRFSSRESSNGPQLVLTLASEDAPTPTPTVALPTASPTALDETVLVGAGDIATCDREQDELTAQLLDTIPGTVFAVGDNAYKDGTYAEYTDCYDPTWGRHKSRTKPAPGNHEYNTSGAAGYFEYFEDIASYYAYDLDSWRIYVLNSEIDVSISSPQVAWLVADLADNPRQCALAYWHRPRWSSGERHNDQPDLQIQALWQIFYEAGAEVVINGHEHNYERFAEMDASGNPVSPGLREFVVGTGGAGLYPFGTVHPASEVRDASSFGVLKLTLRETSYDWEFIPVIGSTFTDRGSGDCH